MTKFDALKEFEDAGALMKGHFILSSGLHSDTYLNKSIVSMYPDRAERLCRALAEKIMGEVNGIDYVISPAMGAIIYGYETARHLKVPFMFLERVDGEFQLRRGFSIEKGARVVVVEDIVSTGLSAWMRSGAPSWRVSAFASGVSGFVLPALAVAPVARQPVCGRGLARR